MIIIVASERVRQLVEQMNRRRQHELTQISSKAQTEIIQEIETAQDVRRVILEAAYLRTDVVTALIERLSATQPQLQIIYIGVGLVGDSFWAAEAVRLGLPAENCLFAEHDAEIKMRLGALLSKPPTLPVASEQMFPQPAIKPLGAYAPKEINPETRGHIRSQNGTKCKFKLNAWIDI